MRYTTLGKFLTTCPQPQTEEFFEAWCKDVYHTLIQIMADSPELESLVDTIPPIAHYKKWIVELSNWMLELPEDMFLELHQSIILTP